MKIVCTFVAIFFASTATQCLMRAEEVHDVVEITTKCILQDGEKAPIAGEPLRILVSIRNKEGNPILIECLRLKGVEQLREQPRPNSQAYVYSSYIDSVQIEFLKDGRGVVLADTVLFPFCALLNPKQFGICVIQSKTPQEPGEYSVRLTWRPLDKRGIPSDPKADKAPAAAIVVPMSQFPVTGMDTIELFPRR